MVIALSSVIIVGGLFIIARTLWKHQPVVKDVRANEAHRRKRGFSAYDLKIANTSTRGNKSKMTLDEFHSIVTNSKLSNE